MKNLAFALLAYIVSLSPCMANEISFMLYSVENGERAVIASETKTYSPDDFLVRSVDRKGQFYGVRKILELYDGFSVGILDTLDNSEGFGLSVEVLPLGTNPNDFSWEWYDHERSNLFVKRQGDTEVRVEFAGLPLSTELRSVSFLEDTEFEYTVDICCEEGRNTSTHIILIRKGSKLVFPE